MLGGWVNRTFPASLKDLFIVYFFYPWYSSLRKEERTMGTRHTRRLILITILLILWLPAEKSTAAAPPPQADDPVAQCAEGDRLFREGKATEALPLLEAGFAGREEATFDDPNSLGICALALGLLRDGAGDWDGALEAYGVALEAFQSTGNRGFEGATLNNIGTFYYTQGRYAEALEAYLQALAIMRELGERTREADVLNSIGQIYYNQGRYAEALETFQQALLIRREMGDRAGEGATLGNIGSIYYRQGRYGEALETYQQALEVVREVGDRPGEGVVLNGFGSVYRAQGRYAEALDYYQRALAIMREVGNRASEGRTLDNIGQVYDSQGRYAEALEVFQQALEIAREVGDRTGKGTTLNNIGGIYHAQGRYTEALETYQQALEIRREVNDRAGEGVTLNNVGEVYHNQGRYGEALEAFQQALVILREVGDRFGEGATLSNIGVIYHRQGRYPEALDAYQQALAVTREVGDQAGEGTTLNNIGGIYHAQGRYTEALETYQQALEIAREVGDRVGEGVTLGNIGTVYDYQERYAEALEVFQQALEIAREVGDRFGEATMLNNIGALYDDQGRYVEALNYYRQALAIDRELGNRASEGSTLSNIGFAYQQQGEIDEALAYCEQAIDVLESVRAVAGSEAGRAGFIAQHASLYNRAVGLYHQQGQDAEAFRTSERGRARAFLDSLTTGYVELSDNAAADLWNREQEAYAVRQATQDALARARALDPPDPALVADLEAQLAAAEEEYAAALAAIEARGGQLAALVPGRSAVLELSKVQALLDEQIALVSYFVMEDETLAFLTTHDGFHTIALDVSREDLKQQIQAFRNFPNLNVAHPESAVTLYDWLIAPLEAHLVSPSPRHLVIIPHNVLHYLPFAALTDGERYLVDDYVITYLPSASALPFIQGNTGHTPEPLLVLGNPATSDPDLRPLKYAEQEAETLADLYSTQPLLGEAATESALREQAPQAGLLHLAAHGGYNPYNPLYSAIALAPDGENDGLLEVHEVYGLDLNNADLVVLSACETQLGELSAGDELVGLTRAFFFAGTPSVVATLWSVDDRPTGLLMEHFYTHLRDGMGKAEALRQAQLDVREEYPNPYYWSAFVLSGDGEAVSAVTEEDGAGGGIYLGLALVLVLVGIVVVLFVRRKRT